MYLINYVLDCSHSGSTPKNRHCSNGIFSCPYKLYTYKKVKFPLDIFFTFDASSSYFDDEFLQYLEGNDSSCMLMFGYMR